MKSTVNLLVVLFFVMLLPSAIFAADEEELTGWQAERANFNKIVASLPVELPTIQTYWRSPTELWVYDSRPERGIGLHDGTDEQLDMIRKLGIRFVRKTMYWSTIENTNEPGVYNSTVLDEWDNFTKLAKEKGIELVVVVHDNAPGTGWANRYDSYQRFSNFMADMSQRYPTIHYWELWNEMDVSFTDLFGKDDPKEKGFGGGRCYAEMLKITYPAIKSKNPDAWVIMGGLVSWSDFPRGVYENGGRDFFDIMNIHTYGVPVNWGFLGRGFDLRAVMAEYNDEAKPLWNTEFGIEAGSYVNAYGFPHAQGKDDGDEFDKIHLETWKSCAEIAQKSGLYQKYLAYQFLAGNENGPDEMRTQSYAEKYLPPNMTIEDYGFGVVRNDGLTPRPTYEWLLEEQLNRKIMQESSRILDVSVPYTGYIPVDQEYEIDGDTLILKNVNVDSLKPTKIILNNDNNGITKFEKE